MMTTLFWVSFSLFTDFSICGFPLLVMVMEQLRIGSLNINGGRDRTKRAMVSESFKQKKLDVLFLQETHSDSDNEAEWMMWWEGELFLSHGTNTTAGVAVLFDRRLALCNTHVTELEQGRILLISSRIRSTEFLFVNVYAHNNGGERARLFLKLQTALQQVTGDPVVVMGGGLELYPGPYCRQNWGGATPSIRYGAGRCCPSVWTGGYVEGKQPTQEAVHLV